MTNCHRFAWLRVLLVLVCVGFSAPRTAAQTAATISGVIRDNSNAVLPGVTVTVTSRDTAASRTAVTDEGGHYEVSNLGLGEHEVRAELTGFRASIRRGIVLTVGREAVVDFVLELGALAEEVVVTAEAPLVEHRVSSLSSTVTTDQIESLPMNARDLSKLLTLNAGVTHFRHQGGSDTSGYGARMSVGGARVLQNSFTLDGTEITDFHGGTPGGATGGLMGVDTIREFNVITNAFSAQYGRAAGANVVAVTRSGTNRYHGSALLYHRNDALDAKNFFDVGEKPDLRRYQYGGSIGGPITRDRTFVFGSFERLDEKLGRTESVVVPTAAARLGILPTGTIAIDPKVSPYLDLWPLPNGRQLDAISGLYIGSTLQPTTQDYFSARVDHRLSPNHSFFGRYVFDDSDRINPTLVGLVHTVVDARNQYFTLEYAGILSSNLVSRARVGFNRSRNGDGGPSNVQVNQIADRPEFDLYDPSRVFLTGQPLGIIAVTGFAQLTGVESFRSHVLNSYQYNYDLDYAMRSHNLKVGATYIRDIFHRTADTFVAGQWDFGSWSNFLQNRPGNFRIQGPGVASRTMFQNNFGFYAQDDWTMKPHFTLNLGVRYEFQTVPVEKYDRVTNLRDPFALERTVGNPLWDNPSLLNIAPRIGFAWDPFGDGRTSVRGGGGLFYETIGMKVVTTQIFSGPPYSVDINPLPAQLPGLFPNVDAVFDQLAAGGVVSHAVDPHLKNPRVGKWMLSIQREITPQNVVTLAYTGSRGVHLVSRFEYARPQAVQLEDGRWFYDPAVRGIIQPKWPRNEWYSTGSSSKYHGLQVGYQRRLSRGLRAGAAYTFSKSLDTSSAHWAGEAGETRVMSPWAIELDYGLSNFDVRHNLVMDFGYEIPFGEELTGVSGALVSRWQLAGIVQMTSGFPFTVTSDRRLTHPDIVAGGRPDLVPGASKNPVLGGPDQYFDVNAFAPQQRGFYGTLGRNTVIGPGLANVDLSILKNFPMFTGHKLQFRAEVFNLLNRANFSQPAANVFNQNGARVAGAGRISSTSTTARQIQVALRYDF